MQCFSCNETQKFIIHGSHDVEDADDKPYIYTQYTCQSCNSVHEVYVPSEVAAICE